MHQSMRMCLAASALTMCSSALHAQESEDILRLSVAEFETHAQALDLTDFQRDAAEQLFGSYLQEFDGAAAMQRNLERWIWTHGSSGAWYGGSCTEGFCRRLATESRQLTIQWQRTARLLETRYFESLSRRAPGHEDAISSLQRARLRHRLLRHDQLGEPHGAGVDLIALVTAFDERVTFDPVVAEMLREYELRIHAILQQYDEYSITRSLVIHQAAEAIDDAKRDGRPLDSLARTFADEMVKTERFAVQLWTLHADVAQRLTGVLSPDRQPAFNDAVYVSLHANLLRDGQRSLEARFADALMDESFTAQQRERLKQLQSDYRSLRESSLPALHRAYMKMCDPVVDRELYIMLRDGNGRDQEAMNRLNAMRAEWNRTLEDWQGRCDKAAASIDAIVHATDAQQ